ncbi:hypothetical protein ACFQ4Z_12635 [Oceanobacillus oncorhynchi subsp. oncorhynchi]|uniref:hypothetical protein n=1 Tax=Oceanobacillus oncorhynchi TaxID=545501 RepID=UPI00363EA6F3
MTNFSEEFIRAMANSDTEAEEMAKGLPASQRVTLGLLVNDMREKEGIVPMKSGISMFEEDKDSLQYDYDGIGQAILNRHQMEREEEERQAKIREENIRKEVEYKSGRASIRQPYK